jgi:Mannosyl-glycoprotein endo-beta-N-acetylglucosaminidase/LysM domain
MSINSRSRRGLATVAFLLLLCPSWLGALASPAAAWWGLPHTRTYSPHGRFTIDTDLLSHSGLSAWAIDRYLAANTPLPPLGAAFMAAEGRYGINARYLLAHAMLESGFGTSDIAQYAHNLFGYNAYDRDPFRFAARYRTYAKGIDAVARHIREEYLDPHGKWWGGAPTLRGMRFYASDPQWEYKIAAIAAGLELPTLTDLGVRFGPLSVPPNVPAGTRIRLSIPLDPGREGLPAGIRFAVRIRPLSVDEADPAMLGRNALPTGLTAPAFVAPAAVDVRGSSVVLTVAMPGWPGRYIVDATALDSNGRPLPDEKRLRIASAITRALPAEAVTYDAEADDAALHLTATNAGRATIPALADYAGDPGQPPAAIEAWAVSLAGDAPTLLARTTLSTDLRPGGSLTLDVPSGDLVPLAPAVVMVRLRAAGESPASLGPPAVYRVDRAPANRPPVRVGGSSGAVVATPIEPLDPTSAGLLRAPAPALTTAGGAAHQPVSVHLRAGLAPAVAAAGSAPSRAGGVPDPSRDPARQTLLLEALPVAGSADDPLSSRRTLPRAPKLAAAGIADASLQVMPDADGPAAYLAVARIVVNGVDGERATEPQVFWLLVPGTAGSSTTASASGQVPTTKPAPKPAPKAKPHPKAPAPRYRIHIVRAGETLWSIAHRTGWSMDAIRRLNPWVNRYGIHPGDALRIPG